MNKLIKRIAVGGIVLVVVGALAWPKLNRGSEEGSAMPARAAGGPLLVTAYVVQPTNMVERVLATGSLRANEEVFLASETSGRVTEILFREGSFVERGQLLLKINDADLQAQRQRTIYRIRLAEQQVERQKALLEKGGISREEFDLTQNQFSVLQAELELNDAEIAKTEIHAPFDGRLGLRHVSEGSYITPQSRISTLQDISPIKIDFSLPEKFAGQVRIGAEMRFRVAGNPNAYTGTVFAVEPRIDENTRMLQVRAMSPNPNGDLLPGAFADIELILSEHGEALAVPTVSVIPELSGKKVFVLENGRVASRTVETGIRTDATVQIVAGLSPGDTVLTSGLQVARDGMPVQVEVQE
jgi:membrane fusion protein (multidrug efflux system)